MAGVSGRGLTFWQRVAWLEWTGGDLSGSRANLPCKFHTRRPGSQRRLPHFGEGRPGRRVVMIVRLAVGDAQYTMDFCYENGVKGGVVRID
jgi:hypothetical protein